MNTGNIYSFSLKALCIWIPLPCISSLSSRTNRHKSFSLYTQLMVSHSLSAAVCIVPGLQSTKLDSGLQLQSKKYHMCLTDSISHISEGHCPFCDVYTVSSTYGVWPRLIQLSPLSCTAWPFISPHTLWHSSFTQVENFSSLNWLLFSRLFLHFLERRQNSNSILCST